jgi:hypothetical protein
MRTKYVGFVREAERRSLSAQSIMLLLSQYSMSEIVPQVSMTEFLYYPCRILWSGGHAHGVTSSLSLLEITSILLLSGAAALIYGTHASQKQQGALPQPLHCPMLTGRPWKLHGGYGTRTDV